MEILKVNLQTQQHDPLTKESYSGPTASEKMVGSPKTVKFSSASHSVNRLFHNFHHNWETKPNSLCSNPLILPEFVSDLANSIPLNTDKEREIAYLQLNRETTKADDDGGKASAADIVAMNGSQELYPERIMIKFEGLIRPFPSQNDHVNPIEGKLLLSLPYGKYPMEIYNQRRLLESLRLFLEEWILSQSLCPEVSPSFLQLNEPIQHALFVGTPLLLKSSEKFKLFLKFGTVHWMMNDFLARTITSGGIPFLPKGFFTDLSKIVRNVMVGEYQNVEAIPYFDIPLFYQCLIALFHVYLDVTADVGQEIYDRNHKPLLQELLHWIESHKIVAHHHHHKSDTTEVGDDSNNVDFKLRRYLSGRGALLEMLQLLSGAFLEPHVRETCLFKMFYERGLTSHTLSMDIFNLHSTKSAEESFNRSLIHYKKLERCLTEEFPGSRSSNGRKRLERFLRNFGCFIDGEIRVQVEEWKASEREGCFQVVKVK